MSNRFSLASDGGSSLPSTPDRSQRGRSRNFFGDEPSTTPAGPPPSSAASFTPAGAPSASYLGSSIMRGVDSSKGPSFVDHKQSSSQKNLFAQKRGAPLGRSLRGSKAHPPSRLSRQVAMDDEEDEEAEEEEEEEEQEEPANGGGTFKVTYDDTYDDDDDDEEEDDGEYEYEEDEEYEAEPARNERSAARREPEADTDMWLDMDAGSAPAPSFGQDVSDLMMLNTPAAQRVQKEAEDLFRASAIQSRARREEHRFAPIAKDTYIQMGFAAVDEEPELILQTEHLIDTLYDDGVGTADDPEKLDFTLANVSGELAELWRSYAESLPRSDEEHVAEVGPSPYAPSFEKAYYLANLALQIHHSRFDPADGVPRPEPLPMTLFRWLSESHDLYPTQVKEVLAHRPSPACHSLFWPTLFVAILRGRVREALPLLTNSGFGHVRRGQHYAYTGAILENVQIAVDETCAMLGTCPAVEGDWEIGNSDWTLFRVRAQGALDSLRRFAENKDDALGESMSGSAIGRRSMAGMARKAESKVPWEIYENLIIIFEIVLGSSKTILETAQDWCEATVGLFGWWDEKRDRGSRSLGLAHNTTDEQGFLNRLAHCFHLAVDDNFQLNAANPVEVGMACIFEDNTNALIGLLRAWSLPIASSVAEIASLAKWLPHHQPSALEMADLDMEDLEVLGMDPTASEDADGIKDSTLTQYARQLAGIDAFSYITDRESGVARDGWELAIQVLGRMDSPERSEGMVGELAENLLAEFKVDSKATVEKIWRLLTDLGMVPFAEKAAETYGDILEKNSKQYGEAMWYYALAHRPNKVREVMNLLISYSLTQSTVYPPNAELDDRLKDLLNNRNETLEGFAKQDLEAAELLGKMLSGYASLRQFYEIRDRNDGPSASTLHDRMRQAAAALISVIASADDNIRGGLFDQTRDGIVSEDFLLALLGEALVFVSNPDSPASSLALQHHQQAGAGPVITLDHIDTLLKAVEDLEAVGERVYKACNDFFEVVLASAPGSLKGSTPADLLKKSTGGSSSLVLTGSSMLASQLQRSISGGGGPGRTTTRRGWDWRSELAAGSTAEDVLRRLRLGLARDLAGLWLLEADARW
ncbi:hypothetical protein GQ53DRAFT_840515 [Thozetella sp. PMI_491]|nr:hypothetical protein GQ53DRAFT_840515 [Thozetella sp. PMI_491]